MVNEQLSLRNYRDQQLVQQIIQEVESLYVYSVLKSILTSQERDHSVIKLMKKYELRTFNPPRVDFEGTMFKKYIMPIPVGKDSEHRAK